MEDGGVQIKFHTRRINFAGCLKFFLGFVPVGAVRWRPSIALGTPVALLAVDELDFTLS